MGHDDSIEAVCRQFTDEPVTETEAVTDGHINDTWFVRTAEGRYVLQRLQSKMDATKLIYNYGLYSEICEADGWLYPKWLRCKDGTYYHTDASGQRWRMYPYIEAETLQASLSKEQLFACGKGLSRLHALLQRLPSKPVPVYPMLHDLGVYYERYQAVLTSNNQCEESRIPEIEKQIQERIGRFLPNAQMTDTKDPENGGKSSNSIHIIHGDAKLSNILFRDGEVVGMLDWDTVMSGSAAEELADCIRSCCTSGGTFDREAAEVLVRGYQSGPEAVNEMPGKWVAVENTAGNQTTDIRALIEEAVSHLPLAFDKINFELALRYYTDVISKEKTFKERYPGYRLTRVRELLGVIWR